MVRRGPRVHDIAHDSSLIVTELDGTDYPIYEWLAARDLAAAAVRQRAAEMQQMQLFVGQLYLQ